MKSIKTTFTHRLFAILTAMVMGVAMVSLAGCGDKDDEGAAEKAGHQIDKMTDNEGPAEKAGNKVDDALDDLSEAAGK